MHQAPLSFLKNAICVRKNVLYLCSIMKLCVCRAGGGGNEALDIELLVTCGLKNLGKRVFLKTRGWVLRAWPARQLRMALVKIRSLPSLESSPSWLTNPLYFQTLLLLNVLS